jgi:hypothetical protein
MSSSAPAPGTPARRWPFTRCRRATKAAGRRSSPPRRATSRPSRPGWPDRTRAGGRLATITGNPPPASRGIVVVPVLVNPNGARLAHLLQLLADGMAGVAVGFRYGLDEAAAALDQLHHGTNGTAVVVRPAQKSAGPALPPRTSTSAGCFAAPSGPRRRRRFAEAVRFDPACVDLETYLRVRRSSWVPLCVEVAPSMGSRNRFSTGAVGPLPGLGVCGARARSVEHVVADDPVPVDHRVV